MLLRVRDHAALERVVVEELLNQIDVREHHSPAAVALQPELVEGVALGVVRLQQLEVRVPLVAHDLAAREAAHGDDHGLRVAAVQDPGPPRAGGRALLTRRGPLSQRYVNRRASLERDGY